MRRILILLLAVVFTMVFTCIGSAADKGNPAKSKIAWFAPMPHPYFSAVKRGVEAWEKETGIKVKKVIGQEWSQQNENENVEALAAQGYRGFSIYPADPTAANGLYDELVKHGAYVVNFGAKTTEPTPASFYVGTDIRQAALDAAEKLCELIGYKGNILNVLEIVEDVNTITRKKAIEEVVAKYPNVHIIGEVADIKTVEEGMQKIGDALSAHIKEVDGVICTGFTTTVAATSILSEFNKKHKKYIRFVGIDDDPSVLKAIREGLIDTTVAQNPWGTGYLSVELLNRLLHGWTPKPGAYSVYAGHVFVTKKNIDTYFGELVHLTMITKEHLGDKVMNPPKK